MTMLTVRETARVLGVHENTVRRWAEQGLLCPARLPGSGFRRFDSHQVFALVRQMQGELDEVPFGAHEPRSPRAARQDSPSQSGTQAIDLHQTSLSYWMERAQAQGFHFPLDAYNARIRGQAAAATQFDEAVPELPAPWSGHFRPLTLEDMVDLTGEGE